MHVTMRLRSEVWQLRTRRCFRKIEAALIALRKREGIGVVHYSVLGNHVHLIVEAADRRSLACGLQALSIRIAKGLNQVMHRRGRVFHERYHEHVLKTPFEVHRAIGYVLRNYSKHAAEWGRPITNVIDPYSSGAVFDGWRTSPRSIFETACAQGPPPVAKATTWLLTTGWKKHGPIEV